MSRFAGLEGPSLHDAVLEVRRRHAQGEFELIQALMAVEAAGLHRQMGCGTVVDYGSRHLNLDPQKASELLRVGRLLPQYPLLAKVIEEGQLHWSKIREITRVITPGNEERLVEYAKAHTSPQVQRLVVCRPRQASQVATTAPAATTASTAPRPLQQDLFEEAPAPVPPAPAEEPPVKPSEILYEVRLSGSQYAKQEQAANRIRSRLGYHAGRAKVQEEMCDLVLSVGEVRTQIRYQVYLHVDGLTGEGWLDTDRGFLPAPSEVVKQALATGRVKQVPKVLETLGNGRAWTRASHTVRSDAAPIRPASSAGATPSQSHRTDAPPIAMSPSPDAGPGAVAKSRPPDVAPAADASSLSPDGPPGAAASSLSPDGPPGAAASSLSPDGPPGAAASSQVPDAETGAVASSTAGVPSAIAPASEGPPLAAAGLTAPDTGRSEDRRPALPTSSPDVGTASSPGGDEPEATSPPAPQRHHAKARRKIPVQVLRELMEDSEGRCVDCGRRTRVQINHRDEPYSECQQHDPNRMDSRCDSCHAVFHQDDFRLRPGWQAARDRAIARRRQRRGETAPKGHDST